MAGTSAPPGASRSPRRRRGRVHRRSTSWARTILAPCHIAPGPWRPSPSRSSTGAPSRMAPRNPSGRPHGHRHPAATSSSSLASSVRCARWSCWGKRAPVHQTRRPAATAASARRRGSATSRRRRLSGFRPACAGVPPHGMATYRHRQRGDSCSEPTRFSRVAPAATPPRPLRGGGVDVTPRGAPGPRTGKPFGAPLRRHGSAPGGSLAAEGRRRRPPRRRSPPVSTSAAWSNHRPPSLKESGVTFNTPMTSGSTNAPG